MSSATYPPCCPHRGATILKSSTLVLLASWLGLTTASTSLNGQEIENRLVAPAGHMQLWPDDKSDILIVPKDPAPESTLRVAKKWRTNLTGKPKKEKPTEQTTSQQTKSEQVTPKQTTEVAQIPAQSAAEPEVLLVPQADRPSTDDRVDSTQSNSTKPALDCYVAPPLSALSTSIALSDGKLPKNAAAKCALQNPPTGDARLVGAWAGTEYQWSATCMRHRPLYFEEINAERYGYTVSYTFQPIISAARFFATIPALPYKMVVERPRECIYTLGHYRPGSCAPRRWHHLPLKLSAAVVETGFIAGMILIIP